MSCRLFEQLRAEENISSYMLSPQDLIYFGSAVSEHDPTIEGAKEGLGLMELGLSRAGDNPSADVRLRLYNSMAGLLLWKWKLTENPEEFDKAIKHLFLAIEAADEMKREGTARPWRRIAVIGVIVVRVKLNAALTVRIPFNSTLLPIYQQLPGTLIAKGGS